MTIRDPERDETPKTHVCRCGHDRDDHQSKTWQERGEKFYGQVCEHCPCKSYIEKGGPMDSLIESFRFAKAEGTQP